MTGFPCRRMWNVAGPALLMLSSLASAQEEQGVLYKDEAQISPGYTLISPLSSHETFLINADGESVHSWQAECKPGNCAYLLADGSLLRGGKVEETGDFPDQAGTGGRLQRFDWDGNLLWDFTYASDNRMHHHDFHPLPNGNVLLIAWEKIPRDEALAAGRNPMIMEEDSLWSETVVEVQPVGKTGGQIVWKWRLWDHLVQDFDETKPNFGNPAEHPELVNLNYTFLTGSDWIHMNSIDYHAELDQILLGARWFDEVWVIDHGNTTAEAAAHSGGKRGRGGDLLYRWGNPATYREDRPDDRQLFRQHDAHWIKPGLPGAGHILMFNNGNLQGVRRFSSVDEFEPPLLPGGTYPLDEDGTYGPEDFVWGYADRQRLYSPRISGARRLPNGNTLICSGTQRTLVEVTPDHEVVWVYIHPRRALEVQQLEERRKALEQEGNKDENIPEEFLPRERRLTARPAVSDEDSSFDEDDGGTLFNATRYPPDYPAFKGRDLSPESSR